jgi:hypothetical protein
VKVDFNMSVDQALGRQPTRLNAERIADGLLYDNMTRLTRRPHPIHHRGAPSL